MEDDGTMCTRGVVYPSVESTQFWGMRLGFFQYTYKNGYWGKPVLLVRLEGLASNLPEWTSGETVWKDCFLMAWTQDIVSDRAAHMPEYLCVLRDLWRDELAQEIRLRRK